ncbi:hypothetical protein BKA57DRAFT_468265, partial [Linnemannia elongata]
MPACAVLLLSPSVSQSVCLGSPLTFVITVLALSSLFSHGSNTGACRVLALWRTFSPLSLWLLLLFVYIVSPGWSSCCLTRRQSFPCADHFSFLLSTQVSISQPSCMCPEKKKKRKEL